MIEHNNIETFSSKSKSESIEMPSANKLNQPKHLCIRLSTGPHYHS